MKRNPTLAGFSQNLEISFWKFFVHLLSHPRRHKMLSAALLIYLALSSALFLTSYRLYQGFRMAHPALISAPFNLPERSVAGEEHPQRNLLLVMVDQLNPPTGEAATPALKAVWFLAYLPEWQRLTAMPVFPVDGDPPSRWNEQLTGRFGLDEHGNLPRDFLAVIHQMGLSWEYVVVIDQQVLDYWGAKLIAYSELPLGTSLSSVSQGQMLDLSSQASLTDQATFGEALCRHSAALLQALDPFEVVSTLKPNVRTALDVVYVILEWQKLQRSGTGITCEFPILQVKEGDSGTLVIHQTGD